jgi:hypothetical protein
MRVIYISMVSISAVIAQGCTTVGMLKSAGKEAAEGNIFTAAYVATMGVLVGPLVDVFTLGGTLSDDNAAANMEIISAATSGVVAATSSQQPTQGTGQAPRGVSTPPVTASGQTTQRSSAQTSTYTPQISSGATESNKSNTPTGPKYHSEQANQCVRIVSSNANAGCTWQSCIKNVCQIDVVARWRGEMENYWSQTRLRPGGTYRVPADRGRVAYSACSVDPSSGPLQPSSKCVYP